MRGIPRAAFIARWGEPNQSSTFRMGDGVLEFQVELLNDFPKDDPTTADVIIREDTWLLTSPIGSGDSFTLWSREGDAGWLGVQALAYSNDLEF